MAHQVIVPLRGRPAFFPWLFASLSIGIAGCGKTDDLEAPSTPASYQPCMGWAEGEALSPSGNDNPYCLSPDELARARRRGLEHALNYPIAVTGLLIPEEPIRKMLEPSGLNPLKHLIAGIARLFTGFGSMGGLYEDVGLVPYPQQEGSGAFFVPFQDGTRPQHPMGTSLIERYGETGVTFGCAGCHGGQLFGKQVMGMTNRFPRANNFFVNGKELTARVNPGVFQAVTGANDRQTRIYRDTLENLRYVETVKPQVLGLDTSLSHVALSLSRRAADSQASKDNASWKRPRPERLRTVPAESKPAVWWNVKFKNRWLLDGSVVSGNPILTNILWNEIGRGTDLQTLKDWIQSNMPVINDLTTAVYQAQAPHITEFFPAGRIDMTRARRGQKVFFHNCAGCHGTYDKAWDSPEAAELTPAERLKTLRVIYHERTPVVDVGTDPLRAKGMASLEQLNQLAFSREFGIVVERQAGYVPPPLVGIWARYPYFHNNSVPTLCDLLLPAAERPREYMAVAPVDPQRDFDFDCNGYPRRTLDKKSEYYFNTALPGLTAKGHDERILSSGGLMTMSEDDRRALITFLQTL